MTFSHRFDFEFNSAANFDGGVIEVSEPEALPATEPVIEEAAVA